MKSNIFLPFFITTVLLSGYPTFQVVRANPPLLIAQSIWQSFSSTEGSFSVLMPGTPTQEKKNVNTQRGTIPVNLFYVVRPNEAGYFVGYLDFQGNFTLNSPAINQLLSQAASGFAQGSGGRLISQQDISLGNFPGKEIRLQFDQGVIGRGRIYWVNQRMYLVLVATDKEKSLPKSIEGFLNSFQLTSNSTASQKPSPEELNANLRQAVCSQNWSQALKILDQMIQIAPSPEVQNQLVTYRRQLQGLADSRERIPPASLSDCATTQ